MSLIFFVGIPVAWAILAKALGWATAAGCFYNETGQRIGGRVSQWGVPRVPIILVIGFLVGLDGNAGHGATLFGSEAVLDLLLSIPFYAIPTLLAFAAFVYVIRDLTIGHVKPQEVKA